MDFDDDIPFAPIGLSAPPLFTAWGKKDGGRQKGNDQTFLSVKCLMLNHRQTQLRQIWSLTSNQRDKCHFSLNERHTYLSNLHL